jgi:tight adherence protein B
VTHFGTPAAALLAGACVLLAVLLPGGDGARRLRHLAARAPNATGFPPALRRRRLPRPAARSGAGEVAALAGELSVLLRSGMAARQAWAQLPTAGRGALVAAAVEAAGASAAGGADVAGALREAVRGHDGPVAEALLGLAAAWHVAQRTGAPTADVLQRYAASVRADVDTADARESALAAPRATARVLAGLPPAGLLLGAAVGTDPLGVLLGTPAGRVSAVVGAVCALSGWLWTRRLLAAARRA